MKLSSQNSGTGCFSVFRYLAGPAFLFFCFSVFLFFCLRGEASITLKIMGVNPSKEQTQKIVLKAYLPDEIEPRHVIDDGGMEVVYDTQKGSYYVFGEYELEPLEVIEKEIEIEDIWVIPDKDLDSLEAEARKTVELLSNTEYEERAEFLKESILAKLKEIRDKQKHVAVNPQKHISEYRENLKLLESIKADLLISRSLIAQAKPIASFSVWKVFFSIAGFLAVFGLSIYFVWFRQAKSISGAADLGREMDSSDNVEELIGRKDNEAEAVKEEESSSGADIDDLLK